MNRTLDRKPQKDRRNLGYPITAVLPVHYPRSYTWAAPIWLDQGPDGACVGFYNAQDAAARPVVRGGVTYDTAMGIYRLAQDLDGEDWTDGTSMLAGAKAAKQMGYIREYRWAFNLADTITTIGRKGPVGLGINWYTGMFDPDTNNVIHPTGHIEGGHAILANGVHLVWNPGTEPQQKTIVNWVDHIDLDRSTVTLHNSWGHGWGRNGEAFLTFRDLDRLIHENGEVVVPTLRVPA